VDLKSLFIGYILPMLASAVLTRLAARYKLARDIIEHARKLLTSPSNDITDPQAAVEQALIRAQFDSLGPVVKKLDEQILTGKLEVQSAYERGKAIGKGLDVTVVPPDASGP
jgi:hypothetical protein